MEILEFVFASWQHYLGTLLMVLAFACWFPLLSETTGKGD